MDNNYFLSGAYDASDTGLLGPDENNGKEIVQENKNEPTEPISYASVTSDS